jgi:hypothetical protein
LDFASQRTFALNLENFISFWNFLLLHFEKNGKVAGEVGVSRRARGKEKIWLSRGGSWGFPARARERKNLAKSRRKLGFPGARAGKKKFG